MFALNLAVVELNLQMLTVRDSVHTLSQAIRDHEPSVCLHHGIAA